VSDVDPKAQYTIYFKDGRIVPCYGNVLRLLLKHDKDDIDRYEKRGCDG
jgi:hypothetical protein